jgi:hypothetical protein
MAVAKEQATQKAMKDGKYVVEVRIKSIKPTKKPGLGTCKAPRSIKRLHKNDGSCTAFVARFHL